MKLHRKGLRALGVISMFLIAVLPVPCLAQARTQPSESTADTGREPDDDSEDRTGGDGTDGEPAVGRSSDMEVLVIEGTRAQGLKDVPISVTQFGASDIENLRIQNVADLSAYTPNLEINTSFAASNPTLFIRGVGLKDYNSNSTGAVGIWHDGIMMNSPSAQLFSLFDVEGIEVLRGPVGGLGGRNASAGLIRMHSFKPDGEWTSDGSVTYGNLNNLLLDGALGFPIFPETFGETLSARVSFVSEWRDGYTDNKCANWNPAEHGLLGSDEETTRAVYDSLAPVDRGAAITDKGKRYIYSNLAAVEQWNGSPNTARINTFELPDGSTVGSQHIAFLQIPADGVCGQSIGGRLQTGRGATGRKPERTWSARPGAKPLSDYQGLQDTYNDIEYYGSRFQLRYQPTERWDLLGNWHWGENRGDSFHLQSLGVRPVPIQPADHGRDNPVTMPLGFFEGFDGPGFSEITAGSVIPFGEILPLGFGECTPFFNEETGFAECIGETRDGLLPDLTRGTPGHAGKDHYSGFYSSDGDEKLDLRGTSGTVSYEPDWGRFVYVGGYEFNSRKIEDEGDANPSTELEAEIDDETWQITQDLRLELEGDGYALRLGGFYIHEELDSRNLFLSSIRFTLDQQYTQDLDAWNVGGEFHYDFLEEGAWPWLYQISLDGAARYNWEQKEFSLTTESQAILLEGNPVKVLIPEESITGLWRAWTGEATLSLKPLENLRIYGKYTRGFKAGHYNAGLTVQPFPVSPDDPACTPVVTDSCQFTEEARQSLDSVDPEYIDSLEVGLKSSWFDDRLGLSGALFRYWYKDLQVFDIVNEVGAIPTQQLLNADADVLGAEIEVTLRPFEGLMFQGGVGWLDTEFGEFIIEKRVIPPTTFGGSGDTAFFNYEGNPLIAAPEWSVSGYVEYELPLFRWGSLVPAFDFSWKDRVYLDPQMEELISQEPYWVLNARLAYRAPGGGIEVAGWVQNFLDEEYKIDAFDESRQFNQVLEVWSEPRTYGVTISYSF